MTSSYSSDVHHHLVTKISRVDWSSSTPTKSISSTSRTASRPRTNRKPKVSKVLYPIFEKCHDLTPDKYWKDVFMSASLGKMPRSFYYKNGIITYRKRRGHSLVVSDDPLEALHSCIEFFQKTAGMMSETDQRKNVSQVDADMDDTSNLFGCEWSDIKKDKVRVALIDDYVERVSDELGYNQEERDKFITLIRKAFLFKCFDKNNVVFEDGKVTAIEGLLFDDENNNYYVDPSLKEKRLRSIKHPTGLGLDHYEDKSSIYIIKEWEKFLDTMEKKSRTRPVPKTVVVKMEVSTDSVDAGGYYHTASSSDSDGNFSIIYT